MNGDFARFGFENSALHTDDVADVEFLELRVLVDAEVFTAEINLQIAVAVGYMTETCLAHDAFGHKSARNGHVFAFVGVVIGTYSARGRGAVVRHDFKRIFAVCDEFGEFCLSDLADFAYVLLGCVVVTYFLTHCYPCVMLCR